MATLKDNELENMLRRMLREKCCRQIMDDSIHPSRNCPNKRNQVKKIKFHSWGGKRSDRDLTSPKIVIRTPFRPWGGKRSGGQFLANAKR